MDYTPRTDPKTGEKYLAVPYKGRDLLTRSVLSKDSAFTDAERESLGLHGLIPPVVSTMQLQLDRVYGNYQRQPTDLDRYIYLQTLQDRNEILYYRLILEHVQEMVPIIYTPTVAEGCRRFSRIYRQGRGLYISLKDKGRIPDRLKNWPLGQPDIIVATDSERILGIGDQGIGGMGIPVGKLALYVVTAGFHPGKCCPITLDVGTNNQELLNDPLYLGVRQNRIRGDAYTAFIREFVDAVKAVWPGTLLQWEDFGKLTAMVHLNTYREALPTFNDDIQGTAAVVDAGLRAAADHVGTPFKDLRIAIDGAGSAGIGMAREVEEAMVQAGANRAEAHARIHVLDSKGIVFNDRGKLEDEKKPYASAPNRYAGKLERDAHGEIHLQEFCEKIPVDVLIGVSGQAGVFTEQIVKSVAKHTKRPIIMPLSNPTANCEATPANVLAWTDGRAVVATGSPFPDVEVNGKKVTIGQGNNMFIFPGVGLATVVCKARLVTDSMFLASASALRACLPADRLKAGTIYPDLREVRKVALEVAVAVAECAVKEGVCPKGTPTGAALRKTLADAMWYPEYLPYRPA